MSISRWASLGMLAAGAACASRPAPASTAAAAPVASSGPGTVAPAGPRDLLIRESFVPKRGDAAFAAFHASVAADETGGECALSRTTGNGATIVTAGFPARKNPQLAITMTFDSVGHLMRYSERRGASTLPKINGLTDAQRDSAIHATLDATRSTMISLDWAVDQSLAINRGGGLPTEAIVGTVKAMENLPQLGPVGARLERVRRLCGV
jgi:hypothetical protein